MGPVDMGMWIEKRVSGRAPPKSRSALRDAFPSHLIGAPRHPCWCRRVAWALCPPKRCIQLLSSQSIMSFSPRTRPRSLTLFPRATSQYIYTWYVLLCPRALPHRGDYLGIDCKEHLRCCSAVDPTGTTYSDACKLLLNSPFRPIPDSRRDLVARCAGKSNVCAGLMQIRMQTPCG